MTIANATWAPKTAVEKEAVTVPAPAIPGAATKAKWTFMVFMAADNNLDAASLKDLAEMAQAGSTPDVNIIVQLDRAGKNPTNRYRITKGSYKNDVVCTLPETNTGDPAVLTDFLNWAFQSYPAERYFLILWNHGSGWWEEERKKKGIAYDDSQGDYLDNMELTNVLNTFQQKTGKKLDILGMDACLMTMVEVAHQLKDNVQFFVGSEIEEPFDGWPYSTVLKYLTTHPAVPTATLAGQIPPLYAKSYANTDDDITQSAINLAKIDLVTSKLNDLAKALLDHPDPNIANGFVSMAWRLTPKFYDNMYLDLYSFASNMQKKSTGDVKLKAAALLKTLTIGSTKTIIANSTLNSFGKKMKGLAIYFPPSNVNTAYYDLTFSKVNLWAEFLKKYFAQ